MSIGQRTDQQPFTREPRHAIGMAGFKSGGSLSSPPDHTIGLWVRRSLPMTRWSHACLAPSSDVAPSLHLGARKRRTRQLSC